MFIVISEGDFIGPFRTYRSASQFQKQHNLDKSEIVQILDPNYMASTYDKASTPASPSEPLTSKKP